MFGSIYKQIKKQNGEAFAQAIREFDSGIFEIKNLPEVLKRAGKDPEPLLMFLETLKIQNMRPEILTERSFEELLEEAGYDFLVADDLKKQNQLRSFFAKGEELCTFKDPMRFQNYYIIYLIKKGAEKLNRADFLHPQREDAYATSLMSIQILKTGGFIKITNRYNHSVQNPDNTFYSNPDYIAPGLSVALKRRFNVDFKDGFIEEPDGYLFMKNKIYKYHLEMGNVFYGENFYVKDGKCFPIQKDYQLLVDNFILDFKENKIIVPHEEDVDLYPEDAFLSLLKKEAYSQKMTLKKLDKETYGVYFNENCCLKVKNGHLVYANLKKINQVEAPIFAHHEWIEEVYLDQVKAFEANSFFGCPNLKILSLKGALIIPSNAIRSLPSLEALYLNSVQKVSQESISLLPKLKLLMMSHVKEIQSNSLMGLDQMQEFIFYKLKRMGARVMSKNKSLKKIIAPCVERIGSCAVSENPFLQDVCFMQLKKIGSKSFCSNHSLKLLVLNEVETAENGSFSCNDNLTFLLMNNLKTIGMNAFFDNPKLRYAEFEAFEALFHCNCFIKSGGNVFFYMPNLRQGKINLMTITRKNAFLKQKGALIRERE